MSGRRGLDRKSPTPVNLKRRRHGGALRRREISEIMELPDDVLADVFRRLAPRSLAVSRSVCKAWHDIIDTRGLLRVDLLPHSVRGIFIKYQLLDHPTFLSRPSTAVPDITVKLNFALDRARSGLATSLDENQYSLSEFWPYDTVLDHCNGLLLYEDEHGLYVLNPATQQGVCLPVPPCVDAKINLDYMPHLVFDPAESPHYQVFLVPDNHHLKKEIIKRLQENNTASASITSGFALQQQLSSSAVEGSIEWPASTWVLWVFSSQTGLWEERAFTREGKSTGIVAGRSSWRAFAVYWLDALYVQYNEGKNVVRISLSNDKYRVIDMPSEQYSYYLGKLAKGVSLASFHNRCDLRVWVVDESRDQIEWVLRHKVDLVPTLCTLDYGEQTEGSWILQEFNNEDDSNPAVQEKSFDWDSDNDDVVSVDYEAARRHHTYIEVLGFHPYKNVVFLNFGIRRAVAYHLNSSMVQDLGNIFPKDYDEIAGMHMEILISLPYTPCLMEFHENNSGGHNQDQHSL